MAQQSVEGDFVAVVQDLLRLKEFSIVKSWLSKKMEENPLLTEINWPNQFILPSSNNDLPEDQVAKILEFENIIKCEGDLGIKKIQKSINEYQSKHLKVSEDDFINAENKKATHMSICVCSFIVDNGGKA